MGPGRGTGRPLLKMLLQHWCEMKASNPTTLTLSLGEMKDREQWGRHLLHAAGATGPSLDLSWKLERSIHDDVAQLALAAVMQSLEVLNLDCNAPRRLRDWKFLRGPLHAWHCSVRRERSQRVAFPCALAKIHLTLEGLDRHTIDCT